jgi:hypothetical protein
VSEDPKVGERRYVRRRRPTRSGELQADDLLFVEEWDGDTWISVGTIQGAQLLAKRRDRES